MTRRIALVGNPNVGKSTIFNALTGMRQHTGNWAGVTVSCTFGEFEYNGTSFSLADLPGIYSFDIRSEEEAVTRRYVESADYDFLLLICDATCLERGLYLLKQLLELCSASSEKTMHFSPILCVNLCDEAARKGIMIDFPLLEKTLGIPVIPCRARETNGLERLKSFLSTYVPDEMHDHPHILPDLFEPEQLIAQTVEYTDINYRSREERLDRIVTGRITGTLCMLLLLTGVFWLTITGANYPSALLWDLFFRFESVLLELATGAELPDWFIGASVYGVYRVVAWIVSVMLPPMAIFFPLFTLLEDFGLLPRIAYNMDGAFHCCGACGKQCLTMAMGLGCNAAGVTGCRIIDSPRERLIAILTNSLVPCNGRFPLLITMISLGSLAVSGCLPFTKEFSANAADTVSPEIYTGLASTFLPALALTCFVLLGVAATMAASGLLSHTCLKGLPSSFTLELPPYRRPQIKKVIVRSIFDRTLFVLGRAIVVAAPAGLLIWGMANISISNGIIWNSAAEASIAETTNALKEAPTLLTLCSDFFDPLGRLMGLDGVILMAFILGFPANEIVLPIILMAYLQTGHLMEMDDVSGLFALLTAHGWTFKTFICMAIFSLFHWPCSTTCLTIRKETGSWKWTAVAILIPTLLGIALCIAISQLF